MASDTAGNPIREPSPWCSRCMGPTDTGGRCVNGCENGVAMVAASTVDTRDKRIAELEADNERLRATCLADDHHIQALRARIEAALDRVQKARTFHAVTMKVMTVVEYERLLNAVIAALEGRGGNEIA